LTEDERAQVRNSRENRENRKRKAAALGVQQDQQNDGQGAPADAGQNSEGIGSGMTRRGGRR
jgi:hypothetical protein